MFKILVRLQPTAGHENVSNTDSGGIFELHSDVECIIFFQKTSVNDVDDVLLMVGPVFLCKLAGDFFKLFREIIPIRDTVPLCQRRRYDFPMFLPIGPKPWPGVFLASGVGHIEHIPQDRPVAAGINKGNPLGPTSYIPAHLVIPKIVFRAGGGVGPLSVDHKLVREGIFIDLTCRFEKGNPPLIAACHSLGNTGEHLGVGLGITRHRQGPPYQNPGTGRGHHTQRRSCAPAWTGRCQ